MIQSILSEKSLDFAAQTVKFCVNLNKRIKEYVITKQLVRSSTSIGANINEANFGVSRADFISKMQISMKEAAESEYWLMLLYKAEYVTEKDVSPLLGLCQELERMLVSTLKTAKNNGNNPPQ
ncbi:MAG: four helix bundle protein [Oscillospiraceae bacterium]|nr:four helix bundle protein [Oscillospiraceae bacterium]